MDFKTSGDEEIALCVDAICIDQSNVVERTHQVSQMDQVYKNAFRTIIFLGLLTEEGSSLAINCPRTMSRTVEIKFDGAVKSWSLFRFTKSPVPGSWLDSVQKGLDAVLLDLCDTNYRKLSALG